MRRAQTEYVDHSDRLKAINPLLHFCTALGLLPVKVKVTKTGSGNNTVAKAVYRFSVPALTITAFMFIVLSVEIYLITKMGQYATFVSKLQVQIMLYSETGMAAVNILSLLSYRFTKTLNCLNRATNILFGLDYYSRLPASRYWILIILALNFTIRVFTYVHSVFTVATTTAVAVIAYMPYSVLEVIVVLNAIVETSYRDVNEQILRFGRRQQYDSDVVDSHRQMLVLWNSEDAARKQKGRVSILRDLMAKHYEIGDLMLDVYSCFNVDVFATCSNCTTKIILQTYIWYLHVVYTTNPWNFHFTLITEVLFLVCMMCIVASSCENVTLQCKETEKILVDILRTEFHTIDEETRSTIEIFLFQIKSRKIEFSVFGIFVLNRALFYDMLSTCTAFIAVLIQFKSK